MTRPEETFTSQSIRGLQTMLRAIHKAGSAQLDVIPDGIYGKQTQQAVSSFQQTHGLPVTGVADATTWERIADLFEQIEAEVLPAEPIQIIINPGAVIVRGDTGYNVYLLQVLLMALAEIYGSMTAPVLTGVLDAQTEQALQAFQYLSGLPQTGQVDKNTWRHLALQYPMAVNHRESGNVNIQTNS